MVSLLSCIFFFFSSRRRHTRLQGDWSSDVCSSDLRAGSFSRAAALLGITQSAVSHALRALEGELQVQLVRREGPHSPLTDAGTRLLQRANDILQQKEEIGRASCRERV